MSRSEPPPSPAPLESPSSSASATSMAEPPLYQVPTGRGFGRGKVILLGEHAVVYGAPALAAGLEQGALAEATHAGRSAGASLLRVGTGRIYSSGRGDLARALAALLTELRAPAVRVKAHSGLPAGGGLGSSAALGVAVAKAVGALLGTHASAREVTDEALARAAHAWECVFHGNPSGIDTTAALRGGCFRFVRGEAPAPLALRAPLYLAVGHSGSGGSTRAMVAAVAARREEQPAQVDATIASLGALVEVAAPALEEGDLVTAGRALDEAHARLGELGVTTPALDWLCERARAAGALGAKLTGSGGGGSAIALLPQDAEERARVGAAVLEAWAARGLRGFLTSVGLDGGPSLGSGTMPHQAPAGADRPSEPRTPA